MSQNMAIILTLVAVIGVYLIAFLTSPFPYWPTYRLLWKAVLTTRDKSITTAARGQQIAFLIRHATLLPLWTAFWYLDDLLFPGYRAQRIKPLFIVGQPRSGTTLMHRTLAADEETFFAVRHIEWRFPFITVQKLMQYSGISDRLAAKNYWPNTPEGRLASKMHPNNLADWEEDGIFFEERIVHHFFLFLRFPYPQILASLDDFEGLPLAAQRRILGVHNKVLQKVMYLRNKQEALYLSKEVTSHNKIPELMRLYPDARFLIILRPSPLFMGSLLELVRISTQAKTGIDPTTIPSWMDAFVDRMRRDSLRLVSLCRSAIPHERQVRISSERFTRDVPGVVAHIYASLAIPLRPRFATHLNDLQAKQHNRDRGYCYDESGVGGFEEYDQFVADVDRGFGDESFRGTMAIGSAIEPSGSRSREGCNPPSAVTSQ